MKKQPKSRNGQPASDRTIETNARVHITTVLVSKWGPTAYNDLLKIGKAVNAKHITKTHALEMKAQMSG